jgi:hypothetical protein
MNKRTLFKSNLFVSKSLLVFGFIALTFPWGSSLNKKPFIEDAWYGFSIARNIANGFGITIDQSQATNGFQPLQVLTDSILYLFSNSDDLAITLSFSLRLLLHILSAIVFSNLIKQLVKGPRSEYFHIFTFSIYLFHPAIITSALNGLETGLLLFLFLVFITLVKNHTSIKPTKYSIVSTTLCAIALIYTRIDMIVVLSCFLIWYFFYFSKRIAMRMVLAIFTAITPWLFWNFVNFGSIVPISGQQQQDPSFSLFRIMHLVKALLYNASPWLGATYDNNSLYLEVVSFLSRVFFFLWIMLFLPSKLNLFRFHLTKRDFSGTICVLALGLLVLSCYYGIITFATYFYQRYTVLIAPLVLILILLKVSETTKTQRQIIITAFIISILQFLMYYHSTKSENILYDNQVHLVMESIPEDEIVGARQSGTLGYFRNRVINLDGKVNPRAPKDEYAMNKYLKREGIDWLCDWPSELTKIVSVYQADWQIYSKNAEVTCLKRNQT